MRLYNPIYHIKRASVDLRALRHGFQTLGQPQTFTSLKGLAEVLHGRMMLAATVAVPATIIGIVTGTFVQTSTGSIPAGLLVNLILANVLGTIGLQILWGWLSRDLYKARGQNGLRMYQAVVRDLATIHWHSLLGVLLINGLSMGLTTYVLENMHHWQPKWNLNHYVPATLISPIIGWMLLDAPFIRYMNDLYAKQTEKMAQLHKDVIVAGPPPQEAIAESENVIAILEEIPCAEEIPIPRPTLEKERRQSPVLPLRLTKSEER